MIEVERETSGNNPKLFLFMAFGFFLGILSYHSFMYSYPDSPLNVRDKAFNDTAKDYVALLDEQERLVSECREIVKKEYP